MKHPGLIDTRRYDQPFLLAKILTGQELTENEKQEVFKRFEKRDTAPKKQSQS